MVLQEREEVEPWAPMVGRIAEGFLGRRGTRQLAGRKGRFGEASVLSLPILISPGCVCVCVRGLHFSVLSPPWIGAELSERTVSWESEFEPS